MCELRKRHGIDHGVLPEGRLFPWPACGTTIMNGQGEKLTQSLSCTGQRWPSVLRPQHTESGQQAAFWDTFTGGGSGAWGSKAVPVRQVADSRRATVHRLSAAACRPSASKHRAAQCCSGKRQPGVYSQRQSQGWPACCAEAANCSHRQGL